MLRRFGFEAAVVSYQLAMLQPIFVESPLPARPLFFTLD
jgi:hypothetical protein